MKALLSKNSIHLNEAVCDVCGERLAKLTPIGIAEALSETSCTRFETHGVFLQNTDNSKSVIYGQLMMCRKCGEVKFVYELHDTRHCPECPHFERKYGDCCSHSEMCKWYNKLLKSTTVDCDVCPHINDELTAAKEISTCLLCEHLYTDHCGSKACREKLFGQDLVPENTSGCHSFKPGLKQYKEYRKKFDSQGFLFDDSIHIEEFDRIIEQEKAHETAKILAEMEENESN